MDGIDLPLASLKDGVAILREVERNARESVGSMLKAGRVSQALDLDSKDNEEKERE